MTRLSQLRTYPFSLFLCLEWILLGGALLINLPEEYLSTKYENAQHSLSLAITLSVTSKVLVGLMGLRLPKPNSVGAGCYFALELLLFWLPAASDRDVGLSIFILLIIALRNGLLFASKACQKANLILFIASLPMLHDLDTYAEFQARMIEDSARIAARIAAYQSMSLNEYRQLISMMALKNFTLVVLCISFIWVVVNTLLREYRSQQELATAREQLRQYALKAEDRATVNERNRIAREIHDSVGHALTAQSIQLTNAIAFWQSDPPKAYEFLCQSHSLVKTALREIRQSVATLRSDPLRGKPLTAAIQQLCHDFAQGSGVQPHLNMPTFSPVSKEIKTTIYRIVQEALTNIAKHSHASEVTIELQTCPEYLQLLIRDNGMGFDPEQNTTGMGLQGMRERINALEGFLVISSQASQGCQLTIKIPIQDMPSP